MDRMVVRSKAPLRLGLAGGGTDVSPFADIYGGAVLNATVDLFTYATVETLEEPVVAFHALERNEHSEHALEYPVPLEEPLVLHKGVYNRMIRDYCGGKPIPLSVSTHSDIPAGSGLGTSSTLVVTMVNSYKELLNLPLGEYDIAHLAFEIERHDLGLTGGRQDQYAATFGGFNFMEFFANDRVLVNPLRIKSNVLQELNYNLLIYYTGKSRDSSSIIDRQIENVKGNVASSIEAMLALKEQATLMKEALLTGHLDDVGRILDFGWQNKKRMATEISNPRIDEIYDTVKKKGVVGGKLSGAGAGGFLMLYVGNNRRFEVMEAMTSFKGSFVDYQFYDYGVLGWKPSRVPLAGVDSIGR